MTENSRAAVGRFPEGVGFIGLGVMGKPMAGHVLRATKAAGASLHVFSRTRARAHGLVAAGATWQPTAGLVAGACDVVIVMVPDMPDVSDVVLGAEGIVAGPRSRDVVVVVSSTVSPVGMRELAAQAFDMSDGAVRLVDAPVSGGEEGALEGTLAIMAGGDQQDVAHAWPVLAAMGRPGYLGLTGAGQVAKACNQIVVAASLVALGEAAVLAERSGLDVARLFDLLQGGLAASRVLETKRDRIVAQDYSPPSGRIRFVAKDLDFALLAAESAGLVAEHLQVLRSIFAQLLSQGYGDMDTSALRAFVEQKARERAGHGQARGPRAAGDAATRSAGTGADRRASP